MLEERINISVRIEELKNEKGWSYRELAEKTGISNPTLVRYVNNRNIKISITNVNKIARAFNVSPTYLLGYSDREPFIEASQDCDILNTIINKLKGFTEEQMEDVFDYILYIEKRNK